MIITIYAPHKNQPIFLPRGCQVATWGENYGSKMTTTSASQCVWGGNMYKRSMCRTGFQRFQPGFALVSRHLFWGLCWKSTVNLGWSFGGICEGPPVLDVLICSHFESTGLADPDKQTSESLGFELPAHQSCDIQTKLPNPWREPRVVRFQQDDLGLNLPSPPLSCRSLTLGQCAGTKMLKNVENTTPPRGLREESKLNRLNTFIRQTGLTRQLSSDPRLGNRQLPRRPGLQGSDSFAPGSTCALDSPWPTIPTVFICCLSVFCFYLFLSVFICV